ncbi:MAG: non-ribosomal peptide synthetase [Legionellaceae bacterium]|nr:non-ribosomal peptide synthetase [Legionellaceae bacterium]
MFQFKSSIPNRLSFNSGTNQEFEHSLIEMLIKHTISSPSTIVIQTSDESWTYKQLYQDVLTWKNRILSLSINGPALICIHRTPRLISILLALQWLEIPYIPIELKTPLERIQAIIEDSKATTLFHDTSNHSSYMTLPCTVTALKELEQIGRADINTIYEQPMPSKNAIAYIIYTSGSTGTPKGVSISNKSLNNFLSSMSQYFLTNPTEMLLATTTITFDIAGLELYLPIWQNKTIFLAKENEHKDPESIQYILNNYPITLSQGTPSFWNMLIYSGWRGKKDLVVLCGGEKTTEHIAKNLLERTNTLWNMYGPTEATIWCSMKEITSTENLSIGKPIHNMQMQILDKSMRVMPIGMKGELYISGVGLAKGYINHQRLTEDKFITSEYTKNNHRLYRTGDVACMTENGEFIIFGRIDNQIKLHGYRIELEDIEAHIQSNHGVRECVVGVSDEQLIAYICVASNNSYDEKTLKIQLGKEIPNYMIPTRFIYLESLPISSSGKLDRKALSLPNNEIQHESCALTPMQISIINIWKEVLNLENIGIDDNFFELGGHSLLAARIVNQIQKHYQKQIQAHDIYHSPTIKEFTELVIVTPASSIQKTSTTQQNRCDWMPLTDFQLVLWIANLFKPDVTKLNVVERRRLLGPLNIDALSLSLKYLVQKHDVFSYSFNSFFPIQKRKKNNEVANWIEESLLHLDCNNTESHLYKSMNEISEHHSWQKNKPLIIAKLFHLKDNLIEIQIGIPHMIADQQSLEIFFQQLSNVYTLYCQNTSKEITIDSNPFELYARNEHNLIQSSLKKDEVFWRSYFKDTELIPFPKQYIIENNQQSNYSFSSYFPISNTQINHWKEICITNTVTLNDLLCAAISKAIYNICGNTMQIPNNIFINTVKSSRDDPCYDAVIGCFLKSQPVKINMRNIPNLAELSKQVQQCVTETSYYQYASSIIKLASVGRLKSSDNKIKSMLISLIARIYCKLSKHPHNLTLPIIRACKRLAAIDKEHGYLININIWDNFFLQKTKNLFGAKCKPTPIQEKDILAINGVLDVCLFRDSTNNQAFLVISANLKPEFRENLGKEMLRVLK